MFQFLLPRNTQTPTDNKMDAPPDALQTAYFAAHRSAVQEQMGEAADAVFREATAVDPAAAIGLKLMRDAATPLVLPLKEDDASANGKWSITSWLSGMHLHRVLAAAIQRPLGPNATSDAVLAHLKGLRNREELADLLCTGALLEGIVDLVWGEVKTLQRTGAASSEEIQSKFADAIRLSYSDLDTFFGGLEGVVGAPKPMVRAAMEAEHTQGPGTESTDPFVTGNYGVRTFSAAEWHFSAGGDDASPSMLELQRWPEEAEDKLPDRSRCRQRRPVAELEKEVVSRNEQLIKAGQPEVIKAELIAANLYTGPMFQKYNAVLRGLQSDDDYLRSAMVKLCCPAETFVQYAAKTLDYAQALGKLNKYTTTLHGINSAIIKLGKLTKATKVCARCPPVSAHASRLTPQRLISWRART